MPARTQAREQILVVDDDPKIVNLVRAYLVAAGFDVVTAADGRSAVERASATQPRLVVLDLMLPELDGFEVTRRIRQSSQVPILMLTARGAVADRIRGLAEGADDYLAKPFSPAELVARVQAILRRVNAVVDADVLRYRDLEIDVARHRATQRGRLLELSALEFRLLAAIVAASGRVLSREQLIESVGADLAELAMERSIDVYIFRIRQKLGDSAARPTYIQTVRGVGYQSLRT